MLYQLSHVRMYYGIEFSRGSAVLNTSRWTLWLVPYVLNSHPLSRDDDARTEGRTTRA